MEVAHSKTGCVGYQRPDRPVLKTEYAVLSRRIFAKPHFIDAVKATLTQMALDGIPVNGILHTGKLHISISIVWVAVGVNIGFRSEPPVSDLLGFHK